MSGEVLSVFWGEELVGELWSDDGGRRPQFRYAPTARRAVSVSLPLPNERRPQSRASARTLDNNDGAVDGSFFSNLLPEARERERVAQALGVSEENTMQLLRALGGDCAGALVLLPKGQSPAAAASELVPLSDKLLMSMRIDGALPVLVQEGLRLSLAGAQEKLPVVVDSERLFLPKGGAPPSTHLLKFPSRLFPGLVENELLMMRLAKAVGLAVADVRLWRLPGGESALLVERFDRQGGQRLHQEDLCQATGRSEHLKYEEEGGPTLEEVVGVLRAASANPVVDLERLFRWQAFNVLTGNNDGHGKNLALLHEPVVRLAPAYDLVCTRAWNGISKTLALRVGDARLAGEVGPRAWAKEADRCAIGKKLIVELVAEMHARVRDTLPSVVNALMAEVNPTPLRAAAIQIEEHCRWAESRMRTEPDWAVAKKQTSGRKEPS